LSVNVTPAQLSTYGFVNPAIALLLGWWILDETLGPLQMVGTLVILGGTLLVNWPRPAPALAPAPAAITAITGAAEAPLSSAKREAPPAT
jgi:drug/metabolite transporter (DMT)-like permease